MLSLKGWGTNLIIAPNVEMLGCVSINLRIVKSQNEEEGAEVWEVEQPADVGSHLNCVIHRLCLAPKIENIQQRHNLFRTSEQSKKKQWTLL